MSEEEEVQLGAGMIEFGEPWSVRIPAAINNAKELLNGKTDALGLEGPNGFINITAGELALAKALWDELPNFHESPDGIPCFEKMEGVSDACLTCDACMELRAFTEKVEKLR